MAKKQKPSYEPTDEEVVAVSETVDRMLRSSRPTCPECDSSFVQCKSRDPQNPNKRYYRCGICDEPFIAEVIR